MRVSNHLILHTRTLFLFITDNVRNVYLLDFGMAQHLRAGDSSESFRGSPLYMVYFDKIA